MSVIDKRDVEGILHQYECSVLFHDDSQSHGTWTYEVRNGEALLQIQYITDEDATICRVSHGRPDGKVSGFIKLGVLDRFNADQGLFLDSIMYGLELMKIGKRT